MKDNFKFQQFHVKKNNFEEILLIERKKINKEMSEDISSTIHISVWKQEGSVSRAAKCRLIGQPLSTIGGVQQWQSLYQVGVVLRYKPDSDLVNWVEIWKQTVELEPEERDSQDFGGVVESRMEFWNANAARIGQRFFVRKGEMSLEDIDTRLRDREQPSTISICETTGRLYRSYFSAVIRNNIAIYVRTAEPISGSLLRNASPCSSFTWTELEHVGFDPAPFDLGGFSGSSQYRLPIICSTIAAIYRKSPYKPIFLADPRSRYVSQDGKIRKDSLGPN